MMKTLHCSLSLSCMYKTTVLLIYKNVIHKNVNIFTCTTRDLFLLVRGRNSDVNEYKPCSVFATTRILILKDPEVLTHTVFNPLF